MTQQGYVGFDDIQAIGEKIVEMADRVKVVHAAMPGAQAAWAFEMDGTRYRVVVTVEGPSPETK
ncbi:hypothetical protein [Rhizobium sp. LC145]|uniref:hypothetical protein n=1 Tax=Rhizobium sp. LC145 TaxID=1120688 RepID=UPI00062A3B53|nr:hypothetical protein [Rhizobium sp. LC145]KKX29199.1 hypothetical protein YH62_15475 [Rhizobium sp. LC145]TKT68801.1 hypothetical protein FDR95_00010 [Rhizobiaceae bacterium LC148]